MDAQNATVTTFQEARQGTLYWTMSFYLPAEKTGARRTGAAQDSHTLRLREGVEPLFNDIADRSRPGQLDDGTYGRSVFDRLFSADPTTPDEGTVLPPVERLTFRMPTRIRWTTEGRTYVVSLPRPDEQQARQVNLRRFWYQYGNGALSWHLSFDYYYADDFAADADGAPITLYFLSLLQKLAWPKESYREAGQATVDDLVGITVGAEGSATAQGFWSFVEERFARDCHRIPDMCMGTVSKRRQFAKILQPTALVEAPRIRYFDNRSLFFIHDEEWFGLIQPVEAGRLVQRRQRIPEERFRKYPELIKALAQKGLPSAEVELNAEYWRQVRANDAAGIFPKTQVAYLFLAGFNQNIIDFMNQDASEVLDSLDPIYPNSEEQEEEGFYVRYANPRALITYAPRSRTLEVGNDYIGTCPYAFLVHVLAMHNEWLTRRQEETTYRMIDEIGGLIAKGNAQAGKDALGAYDKAEDAINQLRIDAFEIFDKHRYANPFRYDTERDVFETLDRLRGTSRLRASHEAAIAAMEEQARDLARRRAKAIEEGERRQRDEDRQKARNAEHDERAAEQEKQEMETQRNRLLTILFGLLGTSGVIQALFAMETFFVEDHFGKNGQLTPWALARGVAYSVGPVLAVLGWLIIDWLIRHRDRRP